MRKKSKQLAELLVVFGRDGNGFGVSDIQIGLNDSLLVASEDLDMRGVDEIGALAANDTVLLHERFNASHGLTKRVFLEFV